MAKPVLVTLPFVLLLLDYWPLGRIGAKLPLTWLGSAVACHPTAGIMPLRCGMVVEKIPLFVLAAASCMATVLAQGQAVISLDAMPADVRITNALVSCMTYVGQFFYPAGLAAFYHHPGVSLPIWKPVRSLSVLVGVSIGGDWLATAMPHLLVGWFWYLGMLVPMIGLVQVGTQSMADRYTYLPQIGLCIALAWCLAGPALSLARQTFLSALKGSPGPANGTPAPPWRKVAAIAVGSTRPSRQSCWPRWQHLRGGKPPFAQQRNALDPRPELHREQSSCRRPHRLHSACPRTDRSGNRSVSGGD